jgi:uncharacterized membrane protein
MNEFQPEPSTKKQNNRPGWCLIAGTVVAVIVNGFLNFIVDFRTTGSVENSCAFVIGTTLIFPVIIVAIATFWKNTRNARTQTWIFLTTSIIGTILVLIDLLEKMAKVIDLSN